MIKKVGIFLFINNVKGKTYH